ncbi:uncharacterized protein PRCAT00000392001 [Priceomyces carsonii]|uniref:uncharacterized protein n=1 Tax=Priceomyces carsonii TaxID=28549 RepID=UPI002ED8A46C|nr:unnamed protein product [Priceomyces carsonii]
MNEKDVLKSRRIKGRQIKHAPLVPIKLVVEHETQILIKTSTPYVAALKRIRKALDKFDKTSTSNKKYCNGEYKKVKYISVKGMGRAIEKTLSIGLNFQDELGYRIDILTGSVEVLDEFEVDDENGEEEYEESVYKKRMVSFVEVRIFLKRNI